MENYDPISLKGYRGPHSLKLVTPPPTQILIFFLKISKGGVLVVVRQNTGTHHILNYFSYYIHDTLSIQLM